MLGPKVVAGEIEEGVMRGIKSGWGGEVEGEVQGVRSRVESSLFLGLRSL